MPPKVICGSKHHPADHNWQEYEAWGKVARLSFLYLSAAAACQVTQISTLHFESWQDDLSIHRVLSSP